MCQKSGRLRILLSVSLSSQWQASTTIFMHITVNYISPRFALCSQIFHCFFLLLQTVFDDVAVLQLHLFCTYLALAFENCPFKIIINCVWSRQNAFSFVVEQSQWRRTNFFSIVVFPLDSPAVVGVITSNRYKFYWCCSITFSITFVNHADAQCSCSCSCY